jgi:hypothetical protein
MVVGGVAGWFSATPDLKIDDQFGPRITGFLDREIKIALSFQTENSVNAK